MIFTNIFTLKIITMEYQQKNNTNNSDENKRNSANENTECIHSPKCERRSNDLEIIPEEEKNRRILCGQNCDVDVCDCIMYSGFRIPNDVQCCDKCCYECRMYRKRIISMKNKDKQDRYKSMIRGQINHGQNNDTKNSIKHLIYPPRPKL